jgi:hypothetical protein
MMLMTPLRPAPAPEPTAPSFIAPRIPLAPAPAETIVVPASALPSARPAPSASPTVWRTIPAAPEPEATPIPAEPDQPQTHSQPTDAVFVEQPKPKGSLVGPLALVFLIGKALAFF